MTPPPLAYVEFAPGVAVQDLVLTYWGFTVRELPWDGFERVVWPDGCLSIAVTLCDGEVQAVPLVGPRREPLTVPVRPGTQLWGVRFRPEMGASFLGRPAVSLRDQAGPAHHWLGAAPPLELAETVQSTLSAFPALSDHDEVQHAVALALDRWLFDSADDTLPPEPCVRDAVMAIVATEGRQQIAIIADLIGVSSRHLQRCFKQAVGLSPKEYSMLRQARHALRRAAAEEPVRGLARVAAASGYAGEAQLARDFRRLMSGAPDRLRRRLRTVEHSPLLD